MFSRVSSDMTAGEIENIHELLRGELNLQPDEVNRYAIGRLSGIIDVDALGVGDPLFTLGLARMAILNVSDDELCIPH